MNHEHTIDAIATDHSAAQEITEHLFAVESRAETLYFSCLVEDAAKGPGA